MKQIFYPMNLGFKIAKGRTIFLLLLLQMVLETISFDFASHQFTLWQGNNVSKAENAALQTTVSLPTAYDGTFSRTLALAGVNFHISNTVQFQMFLEPYTSPTINTVTVVSGTNTFFYELSVFVVLTKSSSTWVWIYNSTFTCQVLYDVSSASTEQATITGPAVIGTPGQFQFFSFISFYDSTSTNNVQIGCKIVSISKSAPDQYTLQFQKYGTTMLFEVGYLMLILKSASFVANLATRSQNYFDRSHTNLITAISTSFNIPTLYSNSPYGGYDGYCIIGLISIYIGGLSGTLYDRSIMFDAHTNPFSNTKNTLHSTQFFYALWMPVCLSNCPPGYYYSNTVCYPCIANCTNCPDSFSCSDCVYGFAPAADALSCIDCLGLTTTCVDCSNSSYCTACVNDSYGISASHLCSPCSSIVPNCARCMNHSFCLQCQNNQYLLEWNGSACTPCSGYLSNCLVCTDNLTCTSCLDNSHYLRNDSLCHPCSADIGYCIQCIFIPPALLQCSLCLDRYYLTPSLTCSTCSDIPNCLNCTNSSYCLECFNTSYAFSSNANACLLCKEIYPNCLVCNSSKCSSCPFGTALSRTGRSCDCIFGDLIAGVCSDVIGCTLFISDASGGYTCVQCNSLLFYERTVNDRCKCLNGTLINGVCSELQGCITPYLYNGQMKCLFCNSSANFQNEPDASGNCLCKKNYDLQGATCLDICGDGYSMGSTKDASDDGNLQDGDGCSSSCEIQVGYRCSNGSQSAPSVCVYEGILTLSLDYIQRTEGLNEGVFRFKVEPPLLNVGRMNLTQQLSLVCDSTYQITSISYSQGIFQVVADYTTDMEDFPCNLTLSFDPQVIESPTAKLSFTAQSRNSPLKVSQYIKEYTTIKFIFSILSYIVLALFLLSLPHKMIGAQLLFNCQLIYLSNAFYERTSFLFNSVNNFGYVAGNWSFFYLSGEDQNTIYPFSDRVHLTSQFMKNSLFVVSALLLSGVVFISLQLFQLFCLSENKVQKQGPSSTKSLFWQDLVKNCFLFPISISFLCVISISAYVNNFNLQNQQRTFPLLLNSSALLLTFFISSCTIASQLKSKCPNKGMKSWYIISFLFRQIFVILSIQIGISVSFGIMICIIFTIQVIYFILVIFFRPYKSILHQIGMLICEFGSIYCIILPILRKFVNLEEIYQLFLLFVLQGIISLMAVFAFIRILLTYRQIFTTIISKSDPKSINSLFSKQTKNSGQKLLKSDPQRLMTSENTSNLMEAFPQNSKTLQKSTLSNVYNCLKDRQVKDKGTQQDPALTQLKNRLRNKLRQKIFQEKQKRKQ